MKWRGLLLDPTAGTESPLLGRRIFKIVATTGTDAVVSDLSRCGPLALQDRICHIVANETD